MDFFGQTGWRFVLLRASVVFATTFIVFSPAIRYDILNYDDNEYVLDNVHMREGLTVENIKWAVTSCGYAANWHPLAWISMMGDVSAVRLLRGGAQIQDAEWKDHGSRLARVMHFHNVILHALNAALLYLLMVMFLRKRISDVWPFALALVWALHPLRVEVACWIAERKELTSVFFMLLSIMAYFGIDTTSKRNGVRYSLALASATLAMMAKPVAVTLPAILFVWDWAIHRRLRIWRHVPFVLLSVLTCYLTLISQTESLESARSLSLAARFSSIFGGPIVYLRQTFYPIGLSVVYENTISIDWIGLVGGVLLVLALVAIVISWLIRRRRNAVHDILVFAVAWVYIGLVPMLGIVKVGGQEHNDRYTYWIGCGVCVTLILLVDALWPKLRTVLIRATEESSDGIGELRRLVQYVLVGIIAVLVYLTWGRMSYWKNTIRLYRDAIPKCWRTEVAMALYNELEPQGAAAVREGEMWLRSCVDRHPTTLGLVNLAAVLMKKPPEPMGVGLDGDIYVEAGLLIEQVLAAEPDNERALKIKELIEKARSEAKKNVQRK